MLVGKVFLTFYHVLVLALVSQVKRSEMLVLNSLFVSAESAYKP